MRYSKILLYSVIFLICMQSYAQESEDRQDSPFGIDYIYPFSPYYQNKKLPKLFQEAGFGWVNFAGFGWQQIEPHAPINKQHNYKWNILDNMVKLWQSYGFGIVMTIRCGSSWGGAEVTAETFLFKKDGNFLQKLLRKGWEKEIDRLPAPEYIQDYQDFIKALVERYDGDGIGDMPDLKFPILHYQIGNEYVHEAFWGGTLGDYGLLLKEAYTAAKEASSDAQIILSGITWNDLFVGDLEGEAFDKVVKEKLNSLDKVLQAGWENAINFTLGQLKFTDHYDIVDARGNGPYWQGFPGYSKWLKKELGDFANKKELWDVESRSEPAILYKPATLFHKELYCQRGKEILSAMKKSKNREEDYFWQWYRAEQSRQVVKVLASRLGAGLSKVFIGFPTDLDFNLLSELATGGNPWIGFLDKERNPEAPFYAHKQFVSMIGGFTKVEQKIKNDVWHYTFFFNDGKTHVIWYDFKEAPDPDRDLGEKEIGLFVETDKVYVTFAVTSLGNTNPRIQEYSAKDGKIKITISETPVFIEEIE